MPSAARTRSAFAPVLGLLLLALPFVAVAAPSPQEALDRFRNLTPAERLRLVEKSPALERHLYAVKSGNVTMTLVERGSVEAANVAKVVCRLKPREKNSTTAAIVKWVIDSGTAVKKGDRLVEFDDTGLQERLRDQKASLEQAVALKEQAAEQLELVRQENKVDLRLAEVALKLAELDLKKYSGADRDERQALELKVERAKLLLERSRARAKPREAQAQRDLRARTAVAEQEAAAARATEEELKACVLTAPQDGVAVDYFSENWRGPRGSGRLIDVGEPVRENQVLMAINDLNSLLLSTPVPEAVVDRVRAGQPALVRVDAFPGKVLRGKVQQVSATASQAAWRDRDVKVYPTRIAFTDRVGGLKPGMSGEVRVELDGRVNVVRVPLTALLGRGRERYCYVHTADGFAERRVTIGLTGDGFAEVREGLAEGDVVLDEPAALLADTGERNGKSGR
jgi:RND family efflux transporter MFP subunit